MRLHIYQDYLTHKRLKKKRNYSFDSPRYPQIYTPGSGNRSIPLCWFRDRGSTRFPFGRKLFRNARELAHKTGWITLTGGVAADWKLPSIERERERGKNEKRRKALGEGKKRRRWLVLEHERERAWRRSISRKKRAAERNEKRKRKKGVGGGRKGRKEGKRRTKRTKRFSGRMNVEGSRGLPDFMD